jgi:predicted DNA-binding transcriptional regulator AlpA
VTADEAERMLILYALIDRDQLVRQAYRCGISKNRIHTLTGISRSTIDRIVSR